VISGAGPTVLVLASSPQQAATAAGAAPAGWQVRELAVDAVGAHIVAPARCGSRPLGSGTRRAEAVLPRCSPSV
jgi:homoserine kinase